MRLIMCISFVCGRYGRVPHTYIHTRRDALCLSARVSHTHIYMCRGSSYLDREEVTARVLDVVKKFDKVDGSKVTPTSNFKTDLGLDSLDETEVVMAFEEEFSVDIPDVEADKIKSIEDAINFVTADPNAK